MAGNSLLDAYLSKKIPGYKPGTLSGETVAVAAALDAVSKVTPSITQAILQELKDQRSYLKLIASENYASLNVLLAMGNWLSDKYAEGAPGHRFYAGCDNIDAVESFAAEAATKLFGAEHAYVQPHSGIDANLVAYWTILTHRVEAPALKNLNAKGLGDLNPQDWEKLRRDLGNQKLMGMNLDAGGHLTHGYRLNVSGKLFSHCGYGVSPKTGLLDYDEIRKIAKEQKPLVIVAGYSSYPRKINFRTFREIADEVGATFMVDMAHFAGLVAGKVFTGDYDPVAHAHVVTTTTHKTLRGPRGGLLLCRKEFGEIADRGCPLVLGGPLSHVMAAKAVALTEAATPAFQDYARRIVENAQALAEALQSKGATVLTGGTDNHLVMVDVRPFGLTGIQASDALRAAHITVNKNAIPNDPNGAWNTSGVRLGTPALTTLGFSKDDMKEVAAVIHGVLSTAKPDVIASGANAGKPSKIKVVVDPKAASAGEAKVRDLLGKHPLYPGLEL